MSRTPAAIMMDMATTLIAEAQKLGGPTTFNTYFGTQLGDSQKVWLELVKQFEAHSQALKDNAPPLSYESHKAMWQAAERGDLNDNVPWPDADGKPFNMFKYRPLGYKAIHEAIVHLWTSPKGLEWRAHPKSQSVLPKGEPSGEQGLP